METFNLSDNYKNFLKGYTPENDMFTSVEEIELVKKELELDNYPSNRIVEVRNSVVKYYSELMDNEIIRDDEGNYKGRSEDFWKYMKGMQSVTAVIDTYIYKIYRIIKLYTISVIIYLFYYISNIRTS